MKLTFTFFILFCFIYVPASIQAEGQLKRFETETKLFSDKLGYIAISYNPMNNLLYSITEGNDEYHIYSSSDKGLTWVYKHTVPYEMLSFTPNTLSIDSEGKMYIISEWSEYLMCSTDDGKTFNEVFHSPVSQRNIYDYKINSKDEVFVLGRKAIYWKNNNGAAWDTLALRTKRFIIDSEDDLYAIANSKREIDDSVGYNDWGHELISARNELYYLDHENNKYELLLSSDTVESQTNVFIDLAENNNDLYILSANEYEYYDGDMGYYNYYYEPYIIKMNKGSHDTTHIQLNLSENNICYRSHPVTMTFNDEDKLMLFWDTLMIFEKDFDNYEKIYIDVPGLDRAYFYHSPGMIIYQNDFQEFLISKDDGYTWEDSEVSYKNKFYYKKVYLSRDSALVISVGNNKIFQSRTNGLDWVELTQNFDTTATINCFAQSPEGKLIAGTENGIFYMNNGQWEKRNISPEILQINSIMEGRDGNLFISTDSGLFVCKDECKSFENIQNISSKEVLETENGLFHVSKTGQLFFIEQEDGIFRNITENLPEYYVTSAAINDNELVIASTINNGVFRTKNYGQDWEAANEGLFSPIVYQIVSTDNNEFLVQTQSGLFFTNNDGYIWEKHHNGHILINNDYYNLIRLRDGRIFNIRENYSTFFSQINTFPVADVPTWTEKENYKEIDYGHYGKKFRFSDDGKYVYYMDYETSQDEKYYFFKKIDYQTGKLLEERGLPFASSEIYDSDGNNNILIYVYKYEADGRNKLLLYNIYNQEIIAAIDVLDNDSVECDNFSARLDEENNRILMFSSYIDLSKAQDEQCGITDFQVRDYSGAQIYKSQIDYLNYEPFYSKDRTYMAFRGFEVLKDSTMKYQYVKKDYFSWKLIDLNNDYIYEIDTAYNASYEYGNLFSDDNKYLILKKDSVFLIFNLDSLQLDEPLRHESTFYTTPSQFYRITRFDFINNEEIIFLSGGENNTDKCISYNIANNTYQKESIKLSDYENYCIDLLVAPGSETFILLSTKIKKIDIEEILTETLVDFFADKKECMIQDTITFTLNEHPTATGYIWDFGDGTFDYGRIVKKVYEEAGLYTVKAFYTLEDSQDSVVKAEYISVKSPTQIDDEIHSNHNITITPNPSQSYSIIQYHLEQPSEVKLELCTEDCLIIETPVNEYQQEGSYYVKIDNKNYSSGIYLYRLFINGEAYSGKIVIMK